MGGLRELYIFPLFFFWVADLLPFLFRDSFMSSGYGFVL